MFNDVKIPDQLQFCSLRKGAIKFNSLQFRVRSRGPRGLPHLCRAAPHRREAVPYAFVDVGGAFPLPAGAPAAHGLLGAEGGRREGHKILPALPHGVNATGMDATQPNAFLYYF